MWTAMNEKEREPYTKLAAIDAKRFDNQMDSLTKKGFFLLPNGQKSSEKREPTKDDLRPKRVNSAYTYFVTANVKQIAAEKKLKITEAMK